MPIKKKPRVATIEDVAKAANVAIGTVSRYINGQIVRKENRLKIEKAIESLSFQRNSIAQAMKGGYTNVVGFLVPTFDEFHAELLNHLARIFRHSGRTMLTYCHDDSSHFLEDAVTFFCNQRVDALIIAGAGEGDVSQQIRMLVDRGVPIAVCNNDIAGLRVDRVFVENTKAAKRAIDLLFDLGHRKIAALCGTIRETTGAQRYEGYLQSMAEHDCEIETKYVHQGNWTIDGGYSGIQKFMALEEPPTAIFSSNYTMTVGMLEWIREHDMRIPDDISLVSFDDGELFRLFDCGITAIKQPTEKIAETLASYINSRLSDSALPDMRSRTLDCDMIVRGASAFRKK